MANFHSSIGNHNFCKIFVRTHVSSKLVRVREVTYFHFQPIRFHKSVRFYGLPQQHKHLLASDVHSAVKPKPKMQCQYPHHHQLVAAKKNQPCQKDGFSLIAIHIRSSSPPQSPSCLQLSAKAFFQCNNPERRRKKLRPNPMHFFFTK